MLYYSTLEKALNEGNQDEIARLQHILRPHTEKEFALILANKKIKENTCEYRTLVSMRTEMALAYGFNDQFAKGYFFSSEFALGMSDNLVFAFIYHSILERISANNINDYLPLIQFISSVSSMVGNLSTEQSRKQVFNALHSNLVQKTPISMSSRILIGFTSGILLGSLTLLFTNALPIILCALIIGTMVSFFLLKVTGFFNQQQKEAHYRKMSEINYLFNKPIDRMSKHLSIRQDWKLAADEIDPELEPLRQEF